jgi:CHAT domain-containing protein
MKQISFLSSAKINRSNILFKLKECRMSLLVILFFSVVALGQNPAKTQIECMLQTPSAQQIGGSEIHQCEFKLEKGEFIQFKIEQKDIDVVLRLIDSNGNELTKMDNRRIKKGYEILSFITENPGKFFLEISCANNAVARNTYLIQSTIPRLPKAEDLEKIEIENLFKGAIANISQDKFDQASQNLTLALKKAENLGDKDLMEIAQNQIDRLKAVQIYLEALNLKKQEVSLPDAELKFAAASVIFKKISSDYSEGLALFGAGQVAQLLNKQKEALEYYKKALVLFHKENQKGIEIPMISEIISISFRINELDTALEYLFLKLSTYEKDIGKSGVADAKNDIGSAYFFLKNFPESLSFYNQALDINKSSADKCGAARTHSNISLLFSFQGKKNEAYQNIKQVLELTRNPDECTAPKDTALISNIGKYFNDLGNPDLAIKKYEEALPILNATIQELNSAIQEAARSNNAQVDKVSLAILIQKSNVEKAALLNNMGESNFMRGSRKSELGQIERADIFRKQALSHFEESLSLYKSVNDEKHIATVLSNIGITLSALNRDEEAIYTLLKQSLPLRQKVGDINGEAITDNHIGEVYLKIGRHLDALNYFNKAIILFKMDKDESGEAAALGGAMIASNMLKNKRMAIFYGKKAVNLFQDLRGVSKVFDTEIQKNYLTFINIYYKTLSDLLFEEGSYNQTVQVLNLVRDQQFYDFDNNKNINIEKINLSVDENEILTRFDEAVNKIAANNLNILELRKKDNNTAQFQTLEITNNENFFDFIPNPGPAKQPKDSVETIQNDLFEDVLSMQESLDFLNKKTIGKKHAAVYTSITRNNLYLLLITPEKDMQGKYMPIKAFIYPVKEVDLNKKLRRFLITLTNSKLDPYETSSQIYKAIFQSVSTEDKKTTFEAELAKYKADVLHWSLDGILRYIPMAALSDEKKQYVVEKYETAVFTRANKENFTREPQKWTSCLGLGTIRKYPEFSALEGVAREAEKLCNSQSKIIKGKFLLDEEFKLSSIESLNTGNKPPLIHISTHLKFAPGDSQSSFLLLGDGIPFSFYDMQKYPNLFKGVDLVTAAACDTGRLEPNTDGKEIDAFAELTQRLGASSVIAALWKVDDAGTSQLMIDFYSLYSREISKNSNNIPAKSSILRHSQLNLMRLEKPGSCGGVRKSPSPVFSPPSEDDSENAESFKNFKPQNPNAPCEHPYYWAPFVLYGSPR